MLLPSVAQKCIVSQRKKAKQRFGQIDRTFDIINFQQKIGVRVKRIRLKIQRFITQIQCYITSIQPTQGFIETAHRVGQRMQKQMPRTDITLYLQRK